MQKSSLSLAKKQGIEQGKKKNSIKIAKNLLDVLDIKTIALKTGLSEQEIEDLSRS